MCNYATFLPPCAVQMLPCRNNSEKISPNYLEYAEICRILYYSFAFCTNSAGVIHRALSSHISSSSLSKSKSLGKGPHVIANTFAEGL